MVNVQGYIPPSPALWTGREDGPDALRLHQVIQCASLKENISFPPDAIVLMGFACDEGVKRNLGRPGAHEGPSTWRKALAGLPLPSTVQRPILDLGDITCLHGNLEIAQQSLGELVALVVKQGGTPIVCGGGHEVAWGQFLGMDKAGHASSLAILNLDAHYDLRPLSAGLGNSGTSFSQIADHQTLHHHPFNYACVGLQPLGNTSALHAKAQELDVLVITAEEIEHANERLETFIKLSKHLFLSICLDVFAAPFAPGVSAPQPLGILPAQALPILRLAASSQKLVGCCIAELAPALDRDDMTAKLAAYLTLELIQWSSTQRYSDQKISLIL